MKKIKVLILSCVFSLTACNEDFLEVAPLNEYSDAAVWTDAALVEAFVNNIYIGQQYGFQLEMLASLSDISMTKRAEVNPILNSEISPSYVSILAPDHFITSFRNITWDGLYNNIRACNVFFERVEASDLEGEDIDRLTGEVHFLRAHSYYWLMSLYGGVPLTEEPYELGDDFLIPRSSFEETVDFIVNDLDQAADLLPVSGDKARASRGASLALKSRVLLYAASDLFNSNASWTNGYADPELIGYTGGSQMERWQAAQDAARAVIDLGVYNLYGGTNPASPDEATENYINLFLNNGNEEDIFLTFYDDINDSDWQSPSPGRFYGPNGYHNWGNHTPTQQLVDSYELLDGTEFNWNGPEAENPYENRDPRFYASILYDGANWRQRPDDVIGADPEGIVQTGFYENAEGNFRGGLDTRQSSIEDWNGTYTGYYLRKFIDPSINHQYETQRYPWRQIRYAEVLLNYAEASLELGQEDEAKTYINMIRNRAGMPDIPVDESGQELMERYRNERKIELAYEQQRYFDIRRWMIAPQVIEDVEGIRIEYPYNGGDRDFEIIEVQNRSWMNKSYLLPILLDEINKNELLIQNPGY